MSKLPALAHRMAAVQPFHVMSLLARARELEAAGQDIVHMEIGEPDFDTPAPIIQAGINALQQGLTHYTPALGLLELRRAIASFYECRYGVIISSDQVVVTPGSSGALQLLMNVLINPGDEVLMADPGYPCNRNFVRLIGGEPVSVPVSSDTAYQLNVEHLQRYWTPATKVVLVVSPSNPTGTLISKQSMREMAEFVKQRNGVLLVDEIYHGLIYEDAVSTAVGLGDHVFVINSFSKYFGMTGWRLGWLVAPKAYVEAIDRVAQNIFLAASTPAQYAALAAFQSDSIEIIESRRQEFQRRRDFLVPALRALGFDIPRVPEGAFYLYVDCSAICSDSDLFCARLLEEAGVAVTPGKDFGLNRPAEHMRFAYTASLERLEEGVRRIAQFIGK